MGQSLHWCTEITLKHVSFPTDEPSYCWERLLSWETLSVNANSSYGSVNFKHARRPCPWPFLGHFSCFLRNTARIAPWSKHRVQMSHPWDKKNNEVSLRKAASHISVCNKCDLKWGPLKVYSWCLFLKRSFYSTAFLPSVSLQCIVSKHGIRTASDCLHCVISQKLSFSYVFCIKVTLTHDINSSNISLLRTVVLSTLITSLLKNMMILVYPVWAFAAICGQYVNQPWELK